MYNVKRKLLNFILFIYMLKDLLQTLAGALIDGTNQRGEFYVFERFRKAMYLL